MRFIVDSVGSSSASLSLKISGFSIDVSDILVSGKVVIVEDSGNVTIEVLQDSRTSIPEVEVVQDIVLPSVTDSSILVTSVEQVQESTEIVISSDALFKKLVDLRRHIAREVKLPHYMIFHDSTLKEMASKLPSDLSEMKEISGIGQAKLDKYGKRFLDAILQFVSESEG